MKNSIEAGFEQQRKNTISFEERIHAVESATKALRNEQSALRNQMHSIYNGINQSLSGATDSNFFWPSIIVVSIVAFCYVKDINPFTNI
jgi:chaperonin cofactor prefoldin